MYNTRSGFTLMEIMVVIIVIAVLASVAGPMITSITDQGKISATKSAMGNLKTAMVNFNADLGHYPHAGASMKSTATDNFVAFNGGNGLGPTTESNCLVTDKVTPLAGAPAAWKNLGIAAKTWNRRWKGPYMDGDPADFMLDAWGNPLLYGVHEKNIYLHSAGPDGSYDDPNTIFDNSDYGGDDGGDDIVVSVARVRRAFSASKSSSADGETQKTW